MEKLVADLRVALKLANFHVKIGYPSKWREYSALEVREGDLFGNVDRAGNSSGRMTSIASVRRSTRANGA